MMFTFTTFGLDLMASLSARKTPGDLVPEAPFAPFAVALPRRVPALPLRKDHADGRA